MTRHRGKREERTAIVENCGNALALVVLRGCNRVEHVELLPSNCCYKNILQLLSSTVFGEVRKPPVCIGCTQEDIQAVKVARGASASLDMLEIKCTNTATLISFIRDVCRVLERAEALLNTQSAGTDNESRIMNKEGQYPILAANTQRR